MRLHGNDLHGFGVETRCVLLMYPDVDECLTRNGGCSDRCINTEGSYKCACGVESVLGPDGRICKGTDGLNPPANYPLIGLDWI